MTQQPLIRDINPPRNTGRQQNASIIQIPRTLFQSVKKRRLFFVPTLIVLVLVGLTMWGTMSYVRQHLAIAEQTVHDNIQRTITNPSLHNIDSTLQSLESSTKNLDPLANIFSLFSSISPKAKNFSTLIKDGGRLITTLLHATKTIDMLRANTAAFALGGRGHELITLGNSLLQDIKTISTLQRMLQSPIHELHIPLPEQYLGFITDFHRIEGLLSQALQYLNSTTPLHLALLFQNSSELRPTGGFIGSYADVTVHDGNITNIDVRDIYDPDGQLEHPVLAPRWLQPISPRWGARDANAFFDFPTSAQKVLNFLEASKIYNERHVIFVGAIAINVAVIIDLLKIIGPITLPDYATTITNENFLDIIQKEVESGDDKNQGTPKRILQVLAPELLKRFNHLRSDKQSMLFAQLHTRLPSKDIMIYMRDPILEASMKELGVAGEIYMLPTSPIHDYLALVRSNVGGGKADAYTNDTVNVHSTIDIRGTIHNTVTLTRKNNAANNMPWWHRMPNRAHIELLVPYGSTLIAMEGQHTTMPAMVKRPTYTVDPDVYAIEQSIKLLPMKGAEQFVQFGKTTFSSWLTVAPEKTKTMTTSYELSERLELADNTPYTIVFERQSGTRETFSYSLEAPPGFIWKETNATTFHFETSELDGRTIKELTLKEL